MPPPSNTILLVEDDQNDVFFLKHAFECAEVTNPLQVVQDGQEAMDYLQGIGKYSNRTEFAFPALVLLDLKLPVRPGLEVLHWARQQPRVAGVLIVVLTSSNDPHDISQAYKLGARSFLVKPLSVSERLEMARGIKRFWLELNQFPAPE